jgi:hypothetical protein
MTTNFFHPSLLLQFLDPGSGMGKIRIRDKHPGSDRNTARRAGSFLSFLTLQGGGGGLQNRQTPEGGEVSRNRQVSEATRGGGGDIDDHDHVVLATRDYNFEGRSTGLM